MSEPRLHIQLLGPPVVTIDGRPMKVDTRKALAVLAYLVATGQPQSRQRLAALLWQDADDIAARGALRRTLSTLKSALGGRHVLVERDVVGLDRTWIDADVWLLRAASNGEGTSAAAADAALRGEFLAGFGLRDAPEFDDWMLAESDAWRQRAISVLDRLAERQADDGDLPRAIETARRRVELDRLDEAGHRQLMSLHARGGDREAALRQYRSCVRLLASELDVDPLPETTALHDALLAGTTSDLEPSGAPVADQPVAMPLVGRETSLQLLRGAWRTRASTLVLVEGEAGIGKTRLAAEFAALVQAEGGRVAHLRGYPTHGSTPYAPVAELVERIAAGEPHRLSGLDRAVLVEVAHLVPGVVRPPVEDAGREGPGAEARFVDALATALADLAGELLVVDDAQWMDPASLTLVAQVARRGGDGRPLVLICRRPTDRAQDPLLPALAEARRSRRLLSHSLERLDADQVRRLVQHVAPDLDARALYEESRGVPFYLAERLSALLAGADPDEIPAGMRDLVRARVTACGSTARQVLSAAAVIGGAFDADLVRLVSGRSMEETADALDELEAHGIVVPRDGAIEIDHELTRTVILDELGVGRRRLLHRRAANALARRGERRRVPADIAAHLQAAGDDAGASSWHARAGARAAELHAHTEAIEHFEAALGLAPSPDARLHERIAERQMLLGRYGLAVTSFEKAAASLPADEAWRAELGLARSHRRLGNLSLADAHLDAASRALGERSAVDVALEIERAYVADRLGRHQDAAARAEAALRTARGLPDPLATAEALNAGAVVARHRGDLARAREHLVDALQITAALPRPGVRMAVLNNLALLDLAEGSLDSAEARFRQALAMATETRDRHHEAALRNNLADGLHAAGRRDEAITEVARSATILAELGGIGGEAGDPSPELWRLVDW